MRYRSGVRRVEHLGRHTVCHLGGGGLSGAACCDAGTWSGWGVRGERWQRTWVTWLPCEAQDPMGALRQIL